MRPTIWLKLSRVIMNSKSDNIIVQFYNQIMNSEDGYERLVRINNKFTRNYNHINPLKPVGEISKKLYYRIKQLDLINPNDEIFKDNELKEDLYNTCLFYHFTINNVLNIKLFYYYEMLNMTRDLNKEEEYIYKFYLILATIFLNKTDEFINKISRLDNMQINKLKIKD